MEYNNLQSLDKITKIIKRGITPKYTNNKQINVINQRCIRNGIVNFEFVRFHDSNKKIQNEKYLQDYDVLVNSTGVGTLGRVAQFKKYDNKTYTVDSHVTIVRPIDEIDKLYFGYAIKEKEPFIASMGEGSTGQTELSRVRLGEEVFINVPSLDKQKKIALTLFSLDKKIEVNNKVIANLEEQAQAIFKSWFVDFEPFQDGSFVESELGLIPEEWEVKEVKDICDLKIGRTPPRKESEWFSDNNGIKWVSIKDMGNSQMYIFDTTEFLTKEAIDKFNVPLVEENTLILSFKLTVGRIAIASEKICTNEAIAQFKNPIINSLYLYFYFKNFSFETLGNTSSIGNAVNSKIIREIRILIPNNEVLDDFLITIKPISDYIRVLLSQNKKLAEIRDALLPKLMSGKIDVSNIKIKGEEVKNE